MSFASAAIRACPSVLNGGQVPPPLYSGPVVRYARQLFKLFHSSCLPRKNDARWFRFPSHQRFLGFRGRYWRACRDAIISGSRVEFDAFAFEMAAFLQPLLGRGRADTCSFIHRITFCSDDLVGGKPCTRYTDNGCRTPKSSALPPESGLTIFRLEWLEDGGCVIESIRLTGLHCRQLGIWYHWQALSRIVRVGRSVQSRKGAFGDLFQWLYT